jgi:hypothetical protein
MPNVTLNWTEPEVFNKIRDYGHYAGITAVYHLYSDEVCYPYPRNNRDVNGGSRIFFFGGTADLGAELGNLQQGAIDCVQRQLARGKSLLLSYAPLSYAEIQQRQDDTARPKSYPIAEYAQSVAAVLNWMFERQYQSPPLCCMGDPAATIGNIAIIQNVDVLRELDCEPIGY